MINLYLLEIQEPEIAQELKEGFIRKAFNKYMCFELRAKIQSEERYLEEIRQYVKQLKHKKSIDFYLPELREQEEVVRKLKMEYKQKCETKQEHQVLEAGFESKPKGWTDKSIQKAGKTLAKHVGKKSPSDKGFFDKCVAKIGNKMKNPQGYCASLKDEASGSTYWRGKEKSKKEAKKDIARHQNV